MKNNRTNRKKLKTSLRKQLSQAVEDGIIQGYKIGRITISIGNLPSAEVFIRPIKYPDYIKIGAIQRVDWKRSIKNIEPVEMTAKEAVEHDFNNFPERMHQLMAKESGCQYPDCDCEESECKLG